MAVSEEIKGLERALETVRARLLETAVTEPGFGEVRAMYNDLTSTLIKAAHKADDEVARQLETVSKEIAEEWSTNSATIGGWTTVLKDVVGSVGSVLGLAGIPNPLAALNIL